MKIINILISFLVLNSTSFADVTPEELGKIGEIKNELRAAHELTSADILELQEILANHSSFSINNYNIAMTRYAEGNLSSWALGILGILESNNDLYHYLYRDNGKLRRVTKGIYRDRNLNAQVRSIIEINELISKKINSKKFIKQLQILNNENLKNVVDSQVAQQILKKKKISRLDDDGLNDFVFDAAKNLTTAVSFVVGNIATPARLRNGYLNHDEQAISIVKSKLRPMDLILSSTPNTLSSQMIPGFFTHVAVYLGTKDQLLEIGMWDHPSIVPYQAQIEQGKTILQALINGVVLGSVEDYLNIDSVLIMRKDDALRDLNKVSKQITIGMAQIGKGYDYNFDITTPDRILCTELVSMMYQDVVFKNKKELGFITITPNAVAENIFEQNTKFQMIEFYTAKSKTNKQSQDVEHLRLAVFKN